MELPVKSRKELGLEGTTTKEIKNKQVDFSKVPPGQHNRVGKSDIQQKSRQLQGMILDLLTNDFSDLNIQRVMEKVNKQKPEQILGLVKAVLPKDVNMEVEHKKTAPIVIPGLTATQQLTRGALNGN